MAQGKNKMQTYGGEVGHHTALGIFYKSSLPFFNFAFDLNNFKQNSFSTFAKIYFHTYIWQICWHTYLFHSCVELLFVSVAQHHLWYLISFYFRTRTLTNLINLLADTTKFSSSHEKFSFKDTLLNGPCSVAESSDVSLACMVFYFWFDPVMSERDFEVGMVELFWSWQFWQICEWTNASVADWDREGWNWI